MKILKLDFLLIVAALIFGICFIISGSIEKGNIMNLSIEFLLVIIVFIITIMIISQSKIMPEKATTFNYNLSSENRANSKKENNIFKRCYILAEGGYFDGNEFDIIGRTLSIGRNRQNCNITFPENESFIAEKHCKIQYDEESNSVIIQNTNPKYNTFKNDKCEMLNGKVYYLKDNDEFYIGSTENKFIVKIEEDEVV